MLWLEQQRLPRRLVWMTWAILIVGSLAPLVLYAALSARIPTVTPERAKQMLRDLGGGAVLVDLRAPAGFAAGHIEGAANWPLEAILATDRSAGVPPALQGKTLLILCDTGVASAWATWHLNRLGARPAWNVRGGIQEWIRCAVRQKDVQLDRWRAGSDRASEFPYRESPLWQQGLAVLSYFVIKPIYMLASLALVGVLLGKKSLDLAALRWAMIFFFLGEAACAVNYFGFRETSYLAEYLHSLGMVLCFGFTAYAVLEGIDRRILLVSDPQRRCASMMLCTGCVKYGTVPCGLKQMFYLIIPTMGLLTLMLLTADWKDGSYNTRIFGTLYHYAHLRIFQKFENSYCALAAIVLFALSLVVLVRNREDAMAGAKIAFAAGLGCLAFGMLRMVLGAAYNENRVWFLFWEEATEMLFIGAVAFILGIFRRGLQCFGESPRGQSPSAGVLA